MALLRAELAELAAAGADFVQLDEPVLTELAFAPGSTRTFMCAALAARRDPAEELELAVSLINRVVEGIRGVRIGVHVCRGNWSRDETTLLRRRLSAAGAVSRASERVAARARVRHRSRRGSRWRSASKELGLGVVNPRTDAVESIAAVRAAVEGALRFYPADRIFLNPDCGFGTFSSRPMNTWETAAAKVGAMVEAARELRGSNS